MSAQPLRLGLALLLSGAFACSSPPPVAPPAPASRGTLSLGAPLVIEGALGRFQPPALLQAPSVDLSLVEREVRRHLGDLEQCFERRLLVRPGLSGKVVMHWNILATGEVAEQCVTEDTVGDADLLACVNALVRESRFPASEGPLDVSFPFEFAALRPPRTASR